MIIIGHRGARGLAPENTMAGLLKAKQHGVDEIEFDVRVTKDGVPVLIHDAQLTDAAGNHLRIHDHDLAELKSHKPDLVSLYEVFDQIGASVPLYIEIKPGVSVGPIIAAVDYSLKHGFAETDLRLASYDYSILRELHLTYPAITKIVIERWSGVRATSRARRLGTKRIAMNQRWLWWGFVSAMSRGGWQLTPYTVNSPHKVINWRGRGLYGVVTDFPDRFEN